MNEEALDRRIQKTKAAIRKAFVSLIFSVRYDEITVADLISAANVGRSTFYEHFSGKDSVLADSLRGPFTVLASMFAPVYDRDQVRRLVDHFWENRSLTRLLLEGSAGKKVRQELASCIEQSLHQSFKQHASRQLLPAPMAASMLADACLRLLGDWLTGKHQCNAASLTCVLEQQAKAAQQFLLK